MKCLIYCNLKAMLSTNRISKKTYFHFFWSLKCAVSKVTGIYLIMFHAFWVGFGFFWNLNISFWSTLFELFLARLKCSAIILQNKLRQSPIEITHQNNLLLECREICQVQNTSYWWQVPKSLHCLGSFDQYHVSIVVNYKLFWEQIRKKKHAYTVPASNNLMFW